MKYGSDNIVDAIYSGEKNGNPFLEAMPEIMSTQEVIRRLASFPKLPQDTKHITDEQREGLISSLGDFFLPMPYMIYIYHKLHRAMLSSCRSLSAYQRIQKIDSFFNGRPVNFLTQPDNCAILGVPGIGKTSTIKRCLSLVPQVIRHHEYDSRPFECTQVTYIYIECPADCSLKTLCYEILEAIDSCAGTNFLTKYTTGMSLSALATHIKRVVSSCNLSLIVIDEIQNAVDFANKSHRIKPLIKFLVELTNEVSSAICFVGTTSAELVFRQEMHLMRRTRGYRLNAMKNDGAFYNFLKELWQYQYLERTAKLTNTMRKIFYQYSGGVPSYIVHLFQESQSQALLNNEKTLTEASVFKAAKILNYVVPEPYVEGVSISDFEVKDFYIGNGMATDIEDAEGIENTENTAEVAATTETTADTANSNNAKKPEKSKQNKKAASAFPAIKKETNPPAAPKGRPVSDREVEDILQIYEDSNRTIPIPRALIEKDLVTVILC